MKAAKKLWFLSFINVLLVLLIFLVPAIAGENIDSDEILVHGGKEKAKEMGFNPIPVYADEKGELIIIPGTLFSIRNGRWALIDGDMLINVGSRSVSAENIILKKGEYATVQNGKITKQSGSLVSGTENKISDAKHNSKFHENSVEENTLRTKIELVGSVINFSEAAKYITRESYFQIVKIPENHKLDGHFDGQGRIKVNSTLPKLKISKNGSFAGNLLSLEPGDYTIVPQLFASGVYQTSNLVFTNANALLVPYEMKTLFLRKEKDESLAVISVPENPNQTVVIDIGKVVIPPPHNE